MANSRAVPWPAIPVLKRDEVYAGPAEDAVVERATTRKKGGGRAKETPKTLYAKQT